MVWNIDVDSVSVCGRFANAASETRAAPGSPRPPKHGPGAATAFDDGSRHWSILTKSRGGVVSVIRDLTLDEAKGMHSRLQPDYGRTITRHFIQSDIPGDFIQVPANAPLRPDGEIEVLEVFGPQGWNPDDVKEWEKWPKIKYVGTGQHNYRRCPECQFETDAPEGSGVCPKSHDGAYYGETEHCAIWVGGETKAEYEECLKQRDEESHSRNRAIREAQEHLKKSSRRHWWSIA